MTMNEAEFLKLAEQTLTALFEWLEDCDGDYDVDFDGESITLTLDAGGTYIVSKHSPTKQLWLSSPHSGASHYHYDASAQQWRNTRDDKKNDTLHHRLASELNSHANADLTI